MAWIDNLSTVTLDDGRELVGASFRGVPFFVERSTREGGRRSATHEFIDASDPAVDDIGKRATVFRVSGYVVGPDYVAARDRLHKALEETAGPGELVHPFYGKQQVQAGPVSTSESIGNGGMASFSIEFHHAPDGVTPSITADTSEAVYAFAAEVITRNATELADALDVTGQPSFATASLSAELSAMANDLNEKLSPIIETTQELAVTAQAFDIIAAQADSLVRSPAEMLAALSDALLQFEDSALAAPLRVVNALLESYALAAQTLAIGDTATRVTERANQAAIQLAIRAVLLAEAGRLLPMVDFDSIDDAERTRDALVDAIDELAQTAGNDLFPALVNLRSGLLRAIPGDAVLARELSIQQNTDIPSIYLSYQIYGSTEGEADIVARNKIRHPAFVSGALKVLSDV